jgi:hypothetical protein
MITITTIEDRGLSRLAGAVRLLAWSIAFRNTVYPDSQGLSSCFEPSHFRASTQFMQNKPNFPNTKMILTTYCNTAYENICLPGQRQNKPNFQNAKMNLTSYGDMDYGQNPPLPAPPKQSQSNPSKIGVYPDSSPARRESNPPNLPPIRPTMQKQALANHAGII